MTLTRLIILCLGLILSTISSAAEDKTFSEAIFAGGCFWCTESDFEKVKGVESAVSGYVGGMEKNPSYKQVSSGSTGHAEAVLVTFDSKVVSYEQLLKVFWHSIDPLAKNRQFCDSGTQYRSAIFYKGASQRASAEASKFALEKSGVLKGSIQTEIAQATAFWPAEDYHQDYYKRNPVRYNYYRYGCGRDDRLQEIWGDEAGWKP